MPDRLKKLEGLCPQREDQLRDETEQENCDLKQVTECYFVLTSAVWSLVSTWD